MAIRSTIPLILAIAIAIPACRSLNTPWYEDTDALQMSGTTSNDWVAVDVHNTHSCGLTKSGEIECWGVQSRFDPEEYDDTVDIALGYSHLCALRATGEVSCYGHTPWGMTSPPATLLTEMDAGGSSMCGIELGTGALVCWGAFLAQGNMGAVPAGVFSSVSVGDIHACAVETNGSVQCWGCANRHRNSGACIPPAGKFRLVSVGKHNSCGIRDNGAVECWGMLAGSPQGLFKSLVSNGSLTCGVTGRNTVECWEYDLSATWEPLPAEFPVRDVAVGKEGLCALGTDGAIACWGDVTCTAFEPPDTP